LEDIPQVGKVSINQHIVHGYHHRQLVGEITPEKLAALLLFFGHFGLGI
jgi:hypothetical protein